MTRRILIGAAVLAVVLGAWWFDRSRQPGPALATSALGSVIMLCALDELLVLGGAKPGRRLVGRALGAAWLVLLMLPAVQPHALARLLGGILLPAASLLACVLVALQVPRGPGPISNQLAGSLWFQVPYVGGMGCLVGLLAVGALDFAVGVTLVAKSSDIGGYFAGSWFGKRPLAPRISPKKTVEGAIGGVALPAAVAAWVLPGASLGGASAAAFTVDPLAAAAHGAVIGALAIVSDLTESLLKRSRAVKDSSRFFGQSGGFLDLIDSLLLVGACALAYTAVLS